MTLTSRMAIIGSLPGSPLQIAERVGLPANEVARFLVELREAGVACKVNRSGFRLVAA